MFGVVWDYHSSKLKDKQYKQDIAPKSYKTEIKISGNPGLAKSGFEQPGPDFFHPLAHTKNIPHKWSVVLFP